MRDEIPLAVGTPVAKHTGYGFPGEVRAAFRTREGKLRYVVEATGPGYDGMLHIFSPEQIIVQQGREHGEREADGTKPS